MPETEKSIFKVFIRGSIDAVWREITKTDEVQKCMFGMRLHTPGLKPGALIRMRSPNGKITAIVGEVLEFDPPHRYSHTFRFTNFDDPPCRVTYELKEVTGGVEFTLTQEGMTPGTKTTKQMNQGAPLIVKTLKSVVETGRVPFGMRLLCFIFKITAPLAKKQQRSENWPL
jgi:uncharacterized protein YndB with AHSA1/START domain